MVVYVLILALLFEGEVHFAVFNNGDRNKEHEFKSREACEATRAKQLANMHNILAPGATLVELTCVARPAKAGA